LIGRIKHPPAYGQEQNHKVNIRSSGRSCDQGGTFLPMEWQLTVVNKGT
jgi:hypothetical protein